MHKHCWPNAIFSLDGYKNGPSSKNPEYPRRLMGSSSGHTNIKIDVNFHLQEKSVSIFVEWNE